MALRSSSNDRAVGFLCELVDAVADLIKSTGEAGDDQSAEDEKQKQKARRQPVILEILKNLMVPIDGAAFLKPQYALRKRDKSIGKGRLQNAIHRKRGQESADERGDHQDEDHLQINFTFEPREISLQFYTLPPKWF